MRPVGRATDGGTDETASKKPRARKTAWLLSGQGRAPDRQGCAGCVQSRLCPEPGPTSREAEPKPGAPRTPHSLLGQRRSVASSQPARTALATQALGESSYDSSCSVKTLEAVPGRFKLGHGLVPQTKRQESRG